MRLKSDPAERRTVAERQVGLRLRRLFVTLHLVVGMSTGLLLSVLGLSGSLLVFRHEIDALLEPRLLVALSCGGVPAPVESVVAAVTAYRPGATLQHLFLAPGPSATHEAWLSGTNARLYLDPCTARVLGERDADQSAMGWLFALHTKFLSGEQGESLVGWCGIALLFLGASGLVLWWPANLRQLRERMQVKWHASGKRVNYDLHRTGGFYAAGLLALIAVTGTTLVFKDWSTAVAARLTGRAVATSLKPKVTLAPGVNKSLRPLSELLRQSEQALPGGVVRRVSFPMKPDAPLLIRKRLPGEQHTNGVNYIYLDPYTGRVLRVDRAAMGDAGQRFLNARYPLHIGLWGGLVTRVLHALAGLMPMALFVTGLVMWWNRIGVKRLTARRTGRAAAASTVTATSL
jgi:uncharacterized iron-regulated membrane protein